MEVVVENEVIIEEVEVEMEMKEEEEKEEKEVMEVNEEDK